jgi:hypothetical protein
MKFLASIGLCCLLAGGAWAQRGGSRMGGGGGFHGAIGGSGFHGSVGSGFRGGGFGGSVGGFRGGFGGSVGTFRGGGFSGFRSGFGGFRGGFGLGWPYAYGYPWYGGYSYWPGYDYYDYSPYISTYPYMGGGYTSSYPAYDYGSGYNSAPNVTVVYPPAPAPAPVQSTMRTYDEYGQEVRPAAPSPNSSPIYLLAMKNQVIYAASSYSVEGKTLHYVNLQHEAKQVPLDQVDRDLSRQLNRERHVSFSLPVE